ncbi:MAG: valine--tRNA ligase, partial [Flavobacteriia bacterium]|nr:valine--tRNA ligase [Flavobacteriia bacterium]
EILNRMDESFEIIGGIRNFRKNQSVAQKIKLNLHFVGASENVIPSVVLKMGNLSTFSAQHAAPNAAQSFIVKGVEYFIPFGELVDIEGEKAKINSELLYLKGFLESVQAKLRNERFVGSAPQQVIENERNKESDTLHKIALLEDRLSRLN